MIETLFGLSAAFGLLPESARGTETVPEITPIAGIGAEALKTLAGNILYGVLIICGIGVLLSAACIALGWFIKNGTLKSAGISGVICSVAGAAVASGASALINFGADLQIT